MTSDAPPSRQSLNIPAAQMLKKQATWLQNWLRESPPWFTSLIVHTVLLLVLALVSSAPRDLLRPAFTLDSRTGDDQGEELFNSIELAPELNTSEAINNDSVAELEEDSLKPARPESLDIEATRPDPVIAPELGMLATDIRSQSSRADLSRAATGQFGLSRPISGRTGNLKKQLLQAYGGSVASENAVALGLGWLTRHQNKDGSWSLHRCNSGQCRGIGNMQSDTAATGLALLPFLASGSTHEVGAYNEIISGGLAWLLGQQQNNGSLASGGGSMYSHGIASIALCEAYAMSGDDKLLREPVERALGFIMRSQDQSGGGWRYGPGQPGDTSVLGWQLMALASGAIAGLNIPGEVVLGATRYLNSAAKDPQGATYGYMPKTVGATPTMTAEALLCRMYLGVPRQNPAMRAGVNWLLQKYLPNPQAHLTYPPQEKRNFYYWYYATQVMHHMEGRPWVTWNTRIQPLLVNTQSKIRGCEFGSWDPLGPPQRNPKTGAITFPYSEPHGASGGRLYVTSLALLTLEVYYRHLPLYADAPEISKNERSQ